MVSNVDDKLKVVVVDDFRIMCHFFEMVVSICPALKLVQTFQTAKEAVDYCDANAVDILLMDIMMRSGVDGLSAAETIKKRHPKIKIILCTVSADANWLARAKAIGVESFWYKEYSKDSLVDVINRTIEGESIYPEEVPNVSFGGTKLSDLTDREMDVLRDLVCGYSNQQIADDLGVSINTVRTHITNLLNKTGFSSRLELALNAANLGLGR